jgi:vacuolar-type H+-ATPase subunit F/Vma7
MSELPNKSIKQGIGVMIAILAVGSFVLGFSLCGMACKYSHSDDAARALTEKQDG